MDVTTEDCKRIRITGSFCSAFCLPNSHKFMYSVPLNSRSIFTLNFYFVLFNSFIERKKNKNWNEIKYWAIQKEHQKNTSTTQIKEICFGIFFFFFFLNRHSTFASHNEKEWILYVCCCFICHWNSFSGCEPVIWWQCGIVRSPWSSWNWKSKANEKRRKNKNEKTTVKMVAW